MFARELFEISTFDFSELRCEPVSKINPRQIIRQFTEQKSVSVRNALVPGRFSPHSGIEIDRNFLPGSVLRRFQFPFILGKLKGG
jgi:hypothetical protein